MATTGSNEIIWRPTSDVVERAHITRFMRAHGIGSLVELQRRSVEDPEWYWSAVARSALENPDAVKAITEAR